MTLRRVTAILLICAVFAGGAIAEKAESLDADLHSLVAQAIDLQSDSAQVAERGEAIEELIIEASDENARLQGLLAARAAFVDAIATLRGSLEKAEGRVDTAAPRAGAFAAQETVLAERADPDVVVERLRKRATEQGRSDDDESVVRHRLEVYKEQTEPLIDIYDSRGLLFKIDALGAIDEVTGRIIDGLAARGITAGATTAAN